MSNSAKFARNENNCEKHLVISIKTSTFAAQKAQMAESVDALVSNTSGETRAGSTPALGTWSEEDYSSSDFFIFISANKKGSADFSGGR